MNIPAQPDLLPTDLLERVNKALTELIGFYYPPNRWHQLSEALRRASKNLGERSAEALCRRVIERHVNEGIVEELAAELMSGETYFFRDRRAMDALAQNLLPLLIDRRRPEAKLSIWSVGCSSGEEPLTLAMILHSMLPDLRQWQIEILATDLRARAMTAARRGLYSAWSFRDCPAGIRERYFDPDPSGRWRIRSFIQSMVEYRKMNLLTGQFPVSRFPGGVFDLILCRNVLIYLEPAAIATLIRRFGERLCEGGWLIVSAAEFQLVNLDLFECVRMGETFFYRRRISGANVEHATAPLACDHREPAPSSIADQPRQSAGDDRAAESLDADKHQKQAAIYLQEGNLPAARDCLRSALFLDHRNAMAHLLQGHVCLAAADNAGAQRSYRTALKLFENLPPDLEMEREHHVTAGEYVRLLRDTLSGDER